MKYLLRILGAICAGVWGSIGVNGREEILPEPEDERRNCNHCGYELLPEQVDPALCGACYKHYLEQDGSHSDD